MKMLRETLRRHLTRVACGGEITDAVFTGAFATAVMTPDQNMLLITDGVQDGKAPWREVGIVDLPMLIGALGVREGDRDELADVKIDMWKDFLLVDGKGRVPTGEPRVIGSRTDDDVVADLQKKIAQAETIVLRGSEVREICKAFSVFKADYVTLHVGPGNGRVTVGDEEKGGHWDAQVKQLVDDQEYDLTFSHHLIDVLATVVDDEDFALHLTGPDSVVGLTGGGYTYIISPRAKPADERKKQKAPAAEQATEKPKKKAPRKRAAAPTPA